MPVLLRSTLLLFFLLFVNSNCQAAFVASPTEPAPVNLDVASLERDAVESRLGRKLKFKERIALSIVRGKAKRQARRQARDRTSGPVDGYAVASLVCGILSFFLFFTAIPAVILGFVALGRFKRDPQFRTGKGMAIAGIIIGGLFILLILLLIVILASGGFF